VNPAGGSNGAKNGPIGRANGSGSVTVGKPASGGRMTRGALPPRVTSSRGPGSPNAPAGTATGAVTAAGEGTLGGSTPGGAGEVAEGAGMGGDGRPGELSCPTPERVRQSPSSKASGRASSFWNMRQAPTRSAGMGKRDKGRRGTSSSQIKVMIRMSRPEFLRDLSVFVGCNSWSGCSNHANNDEISEKTCNSGVETSRSLGRANHVQRRATISCVLGRAPLRGDWK
jgi:hypothetical protein